MKENICKRIKHFSKITYFPVFYVISCFVVLAQELFIRSGLFDFVKKYYPDFTMQIPNYIGYGFFGICVLLAYISFFDYLKNFGSLLKDATK